MRAADTHTTTTVTLAAHARRGLIIDLLCTMMNSSELCCGPSTVTYGVRDMRVRVQVHVPESEVVRRERVRESLSVEILSSPVTSDPFTVHVALAVTLRAGLSI